MSVVIISYYFFNIIRVKCKIKIEETYEGLLIELQKRTSRLAEDFINGAAKIPVNSQRPKIFADDTSKNLLNQQLINFKFEVFKLNKILLFLEWPLKW